MMRTTWTLRDPEHDGEALWSLRRGLNSIEIFRYAHLAVHSSIEALGLRVLRFRV